MALRPESPLLRSQLLRWLLVPLLTLLLADAFVSYWLSLSFAHRAYDRSLLEAARDVALHANPQNGVLRFSLPEAAQKVLLADSDDAVYFEVAGEEGRHVAGERIVAPPAAQATSAETYYDSVLKGASVRVVQLAIADEAGRRAGVVRIAETLNKRNRLAREMLVAVVAPQFLLILLAALLLWAGVIRGLQPLERLQRAVAQRSHLDLRPLEEPGVPGEVEPLVTSLNALLERLDRVLAMQNRFIADAAHQLKTPIAVLQAQIELVMRETDPERMRQGVGRLYVGVERLSRIALQLLSLARNEPEALRKLSLVEVDLNQLALDAASAWVPEAYKRDIDLGYEGLERPLWVNGDAARLRELLDNLLDNAIRYSRSGGRVTVRVVAEPRPTLRVSDDGPSIPVEERSRVFDRFHRLHDTPGEGSGLGLSIAREIARIHKAEISLTDDTDGVGNVFQVSFPPL
ncbi:MAG TPA: sensor histidine kinase N-terminal domain-containing protein [Burkholderiales bacterium]|nr:sensor histidine kinase N-terminal domain-containing protein [Burkholderiales bacterium]